MEHLVSKSLLFLTLGGCHSEEQKKLSEVRGAWQSWWVLQDRSTGVGEVVKGPTEMGMRCQGKRGQAGMGRGGSVRLAPGTSPVMRPVG